MANIALTEMRNQDTIDIDLMNTQKIVKALNNEDKKVAIAVEKAMPEICLAVDAIANSIADGGRVAYFGAGTSGRIGVLDASECPPTFGVNNELIKGYIAGGDKALRDAIENSEDSEELGLADLKDFNPSPKDIIIGISAFGAPKYVLAVLSKAQELGCITVGISSNPEAKLQEYCTIFINTIVGPEAITGSSRLKSGTAQKMVLNILSTGAMIKIGKVYQNYMVDLKISNAKLLTRGIRIVTEIAQVSPEKAATLLKEVNNVKIACVMGMKNCSCENAKTMLKSAKGILRKVI